MSPSSQIELRVDLALQDGVLAQRPTGKNKQLVVLFKDRVFKGPFTLTEAAAQRLETLRLRMEIFRALELNAPEFQIHEIQDPNLKKQVAWLEMPNIDSLFDFEVAKSQAGPKQSVLNSKKLFFVMNREDSGRLKQASSVSHISSSLCVEIMASLAVRFALEPPVGDSHLGNLLVLEEDETRIGNGQQTVWNVDIEGTRGSASLNAQDYASLWHALCSNNRPNKRLRDTLERTIAQNGLRVQERLSWIQEKIYSTQSLKSRFSKVRLDLICSMIKQASMPTEQIVVSSSSFRNPVDNLEGQNQSQDPVVVQFRKCISHGHSQDVLLSAVQKYVRRTNLTQGLYTLTLLDEFMSFEKQGDKIALALRTNALNRLVVIMSEEISVHNKLLPNLVKAWVEEWREKRTESEALEVWFKIYYAFNLSAKSRIISDLKTVFHLPPYYKVKDDMRLFKVMIEHFDESVSEEEQTQWLSLRSYLLSIFDDFEVLTNVNNDTQLDSDSVVITRIEDALKRKSLEDALSGVSIFLKRRETTLASALTALWKVILKCANAIADLGIQETVLSLNWFHKQMTHKERPIYLYHAILLLIYTPEDLCPFETIPSTPFGAEEVEEYRRYVRSHIIHFDKFVYDMHTASGKKDVVRFAKEGAWVENESNQYMQPLFRKMYGFMKELIAKQ